jgi:AcrR family transcriptional regulator
MGLLHPPVKTGKTMSYYDESHVNRLKFIVRMKDEMPVKFIRKLLLDREPHIPVSKPDCLSGNEGKSVPLTFHTTKAGRKSMIIRETARIISEKGYRGTTIQDITRAVGISTGTFYTYFSDKKEVFVAAVYDILQDNIEMVGDAVKDEPDILKRLFIRAHIFYSNYRKYIDIINQLRAETASEPWAREMIKDVYHRLTLPLTAELNDLVEAGVCRNVDPVLFAYTLVGILEMLAFRMTFDDTYSHEEIDRFLMDMIVSGFPYRPVRQDG